MIVLVSTFEFQRLAWLPQFVNHYRRSGVEEFRISLHVSPSLSSTEAFEQAECVHEVCRSIGVILSAVIRIPFDAMALRKHHDEIQQEYSKDTWFIWADIDEFQDYRGNLRELTENWDDRGIDIVAGEFVDRITSTGELVLFDPTRSIWEQYPLGCRITELIVKGQTNKVVCSKGYVAVKHANHDPIKGQVLRWADECVAVHHFKWDSTVVDRLLPRLAPSWQERCPWWIQSERVIQYIQLNGNRINLQDVAAFVPSQTFVCQQIENARLGQC
jgi:hypothetical protein